MSARIHARLQAAAAALEPRVDTPTVTLPETPPPPIAHLGRLTAGAPLSYETLRDQVITLAQQLSGHNWTDFNYHDPGVTLLEALCYALTEGIYIAERDVTDHLTAADGRIHFRRHGLQAPERILPARPATTLDYARALLDKVSTLQQLRIDMPADASGYRDGLWHMAVQVDAADEETAADAIADTASAYWGSRNLCEDLDGLPLLLQPRWCMLEVELAVEGAREVTDILADLIQHSARFVSARPHRRSLQEQLARRDTNGRPLPLSELLEGPWPDNGWIDADELDRDPDARLFFCDLARAVEDIDGIAEIRSLSLRADDIEEASGSLPWQGPDWTLQLRWPTTVQDLAGLRVTRRGTLLRIDTAQLLARLADSRSHRSNDIAGTAADPVANDPLSLPQGRAVIAQPYISAFHSLPLIYREPSARTASIKPGARGMQAQFSAYLALVEQWLAHGQTQSEHLRDLYSTDLANPHSYWWNLLDGHQLPQLERLYTETTAKITAKVYEAADPLIERRSRMLDHLLALHGEACGQNSLRPFGWYFSPERWLRHLFKLKRHLTVTIVRHTRDRYAGSDYSRPSLDRRDNTATLQERISLLLGFRHLHSRSLLHGLRQQRVRLVREGQPAASPPMDHSPAELRPIPLRGHLRERSDAYLAAEGRSDSMLTLLAHYFPDLADRQLAPAFLRCAVHAERYHLAPGDSAHPLWIGPDENRQWWRFAMTPKLPDTTIPAMRLHQFCCLLQLESEGLHLVEHLLLRPLSSTGLPRAGQSDDGDVTADFYAHQLTVVFPAWTARCADRAFRYLAEETVSLNCPAHLLPHVLWLDVEALLGFERLYAAWLDAKRAHCGDAVLPAMQRDPELSRRLDDCSQQLRRFLWARLQRPSASDAGAAS
jgi:hypothetical protein